MKAPRTMVRGHVLQHHFNLIISEGESIIDSSHLVISSDKSYTVSGKSVIQSLFSEGFP